MAPVHASDVLLKEHHARDVTNVGKVAQCERVQRLALKQVLAGLQQGGPRGGALRAVDDDKHLRQGAVLLLSLRERERWLPAEPQV